MRIVWTNRVSDELDNNLSFWLNKNKSNVYPNKILDEMNKDFKSGKLKGTESELNKQLTNRMFQTSTLSNSANVS